VILTGRIFDRHWAYEKGILDELAEGDEAQEGRSEPLEAGLSRALKLAEEMGRGGPLAIRAAKRAIDNGYQMDITTAFDWERALYHTLYTSKDRGEGLLAFKEKRTPQYEGR